MTATMTLKQIEEELGAKRKQLAEIFEQAAVEGSDSLDLEKVTTITGTTSEKAAEIRRRNDELSNLGKSRDELFDMDVIRKGNGDAMKRVVNPFPFAPGDGSQADRKQSQSIGAQFVESASYKGWGRGGSGQRASVEIPVTGFKATFDVGGSTLTGYDRQPGIVLVGVQRPTVASLFARGETGQNTIRYVQEDTYTNAATAVAEGATKPEASFDTSEQDAPVKKIAVTAKVTDELFADFPALRDYIDGRLRFMVLQTEDTQLLTGSGAGANIRGVLNVSGIQTYALSAEPAPDAIYKGMVKVMTIGFFDPDGVVMNPLDWQDIRLLRTTDGIYIWGSPSEAGPERIWGLPVVLTTAMTQNTALVGAFKLGGQVFYRQGITVESTNSNEDDFKRNLIALRAEQREALAIYRPKAFCTVTGV